MQEYFQQITSKLTFDEMVVLGYLSDKQANVVFKSVKKKDILDDTQLTTSKLRTSLIRLEANNLIEIVSNSKEHRVYITEYGQLALNEHLKEEIWC